MTNPAAATPGAPVESDAALRVRQAVSVALPSRTVLEGTVGAVASVPGVLRHVAYENTAVADANGLPPHSIALVVDGGDAGLIASAIAAKKTPGTGTHGSTTVVVTDIYGIAHPIRFFRPVRVPVSAEIQMRALAGYTTATGQAVQRAVADYINGVAIGGASASVEWADAISAANGVAGSGTFKITGLALSRSSGNGARRGPGLQRGGGGARRDQDHGKRVSDMANADEYLGLLSPITALGPGSAPPWRRSAARRLPCATRTRACRTPSTWTWPSARSWTPWAAGSAWGAASPRRSPASTSRWTSTAWAWTRASGRPFDPDNGLTVLDDDTYRLLRAKIGANHWDGTLETSAAILNQIFQGGTHVLIEDNGDMSVDIGVAAARLGAVPGPADRGYIPIARRRAHQVLRAPRARAAVRF